MVRRAHIGGSLALATSLLLALAFSGRAYATPPATPSASGSWPFPNADLSNSRAAPDSTISTANVAGLQPSWSFKLTGSAAVGVPGYGSLAAGPIVQNGVVYLQDLDANVYAIDLGTGKLKWVFRIGEPLSHTFGPNGVAVADGIVYGDAPLYAFALDAATGKTVWSKKLTDTRHGTFGIQPQVAGGRVYLATTGAPLPGGGELLALNATTGALIWQFATVPSPDKSVFAAGGAWDTPLVGSDGSVTFGIGNPYQTAASAIEHPSALLFTDSDVNLNAATGALRWYYQGVPDDFKDFDMQASPIAAAVNGVPAVIGAGKMGYVYAMNAETGALLWKTPVGEHNGHDDDSLEALNHESTLKAPYTILPGSLGGVLTNMAVTGNTLYVAACNLPVRSTSLQQVLGVNVNVNVALGTGDIEAIDLDNGRVEWDTKVPSLPLGAATVSNDLVFTTLYRGVLIALNRFTGAIVYHRTLPTSTNAPIAVAGNTVLVPAGGPSEHIAGHHPQLLAYAVQ